MEQASGATSVQVPAAELPASSKLGATLFNVAWLSILLGLSLEGLLLLLAAAFKKADDVKPFVADLVQKVTWSSLVCVGLAVGMAASKIRVGVMGLLGLLSAPLAFGAARSLHKSAQHALSVVGDGGGPSPWTLAAIRAAEYACLGAIIAWVSRKKWGGLKAHLTVGLVIGLVFGGWTIALAVRGAPQRPSAYLLLGRGINEILFPVGCALVLFTAQAIGKRVVKPAP